MQSAYHNVMTFAGTVMEMEVSGAYPAGKAPSWRRRVQMKKEGETCLEWKIKNLEMI